jgi:D-alanyl-D-alanine carboxypeptidase/D-alanyl-D-alanine-endopeptidase (penicillin-binding protein 4)
MNFMLKKMLVPLVLFIVSALAWVNAASLDSQSGKELMPVVSDSRNSVVTPLLSARRVPVFLQAPIADKELKNEVENLVAELPGLSCVNVLEDGRVIFEQLSSEPIIPASTQKLLTAVALLEIFGPDHKFSTKIISEIQPVNGTLKGDLWVVGGGDPLLMTAKYAERYKDPFSYTNVENLGLKIVSSGINHIEGSIIGDESLFDDMRFVDTWPERFRYTDQKQSGPISALSLNGGFIRWDPVKESNGFNTPTEEPAEYTVSVLKEILEENGITVSGNTLSGQAPETAFFEIASIESPAMKEIISKMLLGSDNTTAEILLKGLSASVEKPGTSSGGATVIAESLNLLGFNMEQVEILDASGLDYGNRVTCKLLTELLDSASHSIELKQSLPVAGRSGTLRKRLLDTPAEGLVRGKTGSLNGVISLAGSVDTIFDRSLSFAFITNFDGDKGRIKYLHDQILLEMIKYPQGPSIDLLKPVAHND